MILLVNNRLKNQAHTYIPELRNALRTLNIPYYETKTLNDNIYKLKGKITGIILSGSYLNLKEQMIFQEYGQNIRPLLEFDVPVLGLCFGCELLNFIFAGSLDYFNKNHKYLHENTPVELEKSVLFKNFYPEDVHFGFSQLPKISKKDGVKEIAWFRKNGKKYACGFEFRKGKYYGLMFHPEKDPENYIVFENFMQICKDYSK